MSIERGLALLLASTSTWGCGAVEPEPAAPIAEQRVEERELPPPAPVELAAEDECPVGGTTERAGNAHFTSDVFAFPLTSILIMFAISAAVCTIASILPAWRAARLDPVVAMNRS